MKLTKHICRLRLYVAVIAMSIVSGSMAMTDQRRHYVRDSINLALQQTDDNAAKILLYYSLYDIGAGAGERIRALNRVYRLAESAGKTGTMVRVLMSQAIENANSPKRLVDLRKQLEQMEGPSDLVDEAKLMIDIFLADYRVRHNRISPGRMINMVKSYESSGVVDPYDRLAALYEISASLGRSSQGHMLAQYIDSIESLAATLPLPDGRVRAVIYELLSPYFTNSGDKARAVSIDKRYLNLIDSLTTASRLRGRPYRNFNAARYHSYQRLLANYSVLTPVEQQEIESLMSDMVKDNEIIAGLDSAENRTPVLRAMAHKQWRKAIGLLRDKLNSDDSTYRRYYVRALVAAADSLNDREAMKDVAVDLNELMQDELQRLTNERAAEYRLLYDVYALSNRDARTDAAAAAEENSSQRSRTIVLAVLIFLLIVVISLVVWQNVRMRRLAQLQLKTTDRIRRDRNHLQSMQAELVAARDKAKAAEKKMNDFVNNVSHEIKTPLAAVVEYSKLIADCIPDDYGYLERFAKVVELNSQMVFRLVNDVLEVAALEGDGDGVEKRHVMVGDICRAAIDGFGGGTEPKPGLVIRLNPDGHPDLMVNTDAQRVTQILTNLLSNAVKFTEHGAVTIDYAKNEAGDAVEISVADTGAGISPDKAGQIFDRFVKLDRNSPGTGLGLYISRLLAKSLDGTLTLDTACTAGSRFVLSLPC